MRAGTSSRTPSAALVDSVPEMAREIALIDGAMFDAVNAASGSPYAPIAYSGGPVSNADPNAAALQAALTVMNSLYGPSSQNDGSPIEIGANNTNTCPRNTVGNDLQAHDDNAAVSIDDNEVSGNLQVNNDTATTTFPAMRSPTTCNAKTTPPAATYAAPNTVMHGSRKVNALEQHLFRLSL